MSPQAAKQLKTDEIRRLAREGFGHEDICAKLGLRMLSDRQAVRTFVLKAKEP